MKVESVTAEPDLREFCLFADEVNRSRSAYWRAIPEQHLSLLRGEGPAAEGRRVLPLVARIDDRIVARVAAVVDERYIDHWGEALGHLIMFEALPGTIDPVRALMNEACSWLRSRGLEAARTGFGPGMDMPFVLDAYEPLGPLATRQNPPYYHFLLKEARFAAEKGFVDYKIGVTPQRVEMWERMLRAAESEGFALLTLSEVGQPAPVAQISAVWEEAFASHWGASPQSEEEWAEQLAMVEQMGSFDVSVVAFQGDEPVGFLYGIPDLSRWAKRAAGREVQPDEQLNSLGLGLRSNARGRGVGLALAARSYLELVKRGSTYVSYTLVVDDNWPSRRTGEKLGGGVCANFLAYRRPLIV